MKTRTILKHSPLGFFLLAAGPALAQEMPPASVVVTPAELDIDAGRRVVGESVRVSMPTAEAREILSVPRDALVLRREGSSVFRINDDMSAEQIPVSTGLGAGERIEVIGELEAGDLIVVRGAERLNSGMTVQISNPSSGAVSSTAANP